MKPIDRPFVYVLWIDAVTRHGWTSTDEGIEGVERVWSSGWMVERNKREVKLVSDVGAEGHDVNRRIAIPMQMVEAIHQHDMKGTLLYERPKRRNRTKVQPVDV